MGMMKRWNFVYIYYLYHPKRNKYDVYNKREAEQATYNEETREYQYQTDRHELYLVNDNKTTPSNTFLKTKVHLAYFVRLPN